MKKSQLQYFREFLRSRRLVNGKYIPFYAQRARKKRAEALDADPPRRRQPEAL
jgi:hypothetical protein